MERTFRSLPILDFQQTKLQMLNWADQFNICCFLDNHQYRIEPHSYECLVGAGTLMQLSADSGSALEQFERFVDNAGDWCFGHLGYDLKNEIENLFSRHPDHIQFPDLFFFVPEVLLLLSETELKVGVTDDSHFCVFESIRKISTDVVRPFRLKREILGQGRRRPFQASELHGNGIAVLLPGPG